MQPILTRYTFVLCKVVKNFRRVSLVRTALQRPKATLKPHRVVKNARC